MDQNLANQLFTQSSIVLFLNSPSLTFGIDFQQWETGPKFKGIKFIPNGLHFIYYSLKDGMRTGFFHIFTQEIIVKKYSNETEEFISLAADEEHRYSANIRDFDDGLGCFPQDKNLLEQWKSLIHFVTRDVLTRLLPSGFTVDMTTQSRFSLANPDSLTKLIAFTNIDLKRSFPIDSIGSDLSKYSKDKSYLMKKILESISIENLMGEMQLSFILFILGQIYDGFEQWKVLVHLFCFSKENLEFFPNWFIPFIDTISCQLKQCPDDLFHDILSAENFLRDCLRTLAENYIEANTTPELSYKLDQLFVEVFEKFGWDIISQVKLKLEDEEGEYAPVIVEI